MLDQTPQETQMYLLDAESLSGKKTFKGTWTQKQEQLRQHQEQVQQRSKRIAEMIVARIKK